MHQYAYCADHDCWVGQAVLTVNRNDWHGILKGLSPNMAVQPDLQCRLLICQKIQRCTEIENYSCSEFSNEDFSNFFPLDWRLQFRGTFDGNVSQEWAARSWSARGTSKMCEIQGVWNHNLVVHWGWSWRSTHHDGGHQGTEVALLHVILNNWLNYSFSKLHSGASLLLYVCAIL